MSKEKQDYCGGEEEITACREKWLIPPTDRLSGFLPKKLSNWLEKGVKLTTEMTPEKFYKELDGYKGSLRSYEKWCRDFRFYGDFKGETPEFNTFPIRVRPGFAKEFADAVMVQRARMVLKNGKARGLRTHYNHSNGRAIKNEDLYGRLRGFENALGPALDLMVMGYDEFYRDYDVKSDCDDERTRLQLRMSGLKSREQLEVAPVFFEGILRAIQSGSFNQHYDKLPLADESKESITEKIRRDGSAAKIKTKTGEEKTALDFFNACFQAFRSYMEEVATPEEMELLEKYAKGEKMFEVKSKPDPTIGRDYIIRQTGKTPEKLIADYAVPEGPARLFSDAGANPEKEILGGRVTRETLDIEWRGVRFKFVKGGSKQVLKNEVYVPFAKMEQYTELESDFAGDSDKFLSELDALLEQS